MKTAALVIADVDGLDALVQGKSLLAHAVDGVRGAGCADELRILVPTRKLGSYESLVPAAPGKPCRVLPCPGTRAESIRSAFESLPTGFDVILLCDAARAFVPSSIIRTVAETVTLGASAVIPVVAVTDTVKLVNSRQVIIATEDRARLRTVQSPFGCTPGLLREMCIRGVDPLTQPPDSVRMISGHQNGIRVTTPFDIAVVSALLSEEHT